MGSLDKYRVDKRLSLEDAAAFHGHKGPFLILGYRAGIYAVELLKPKTEFDLEAVLGMPLKTPYTCIVDGFQCATKCTVGKGNIRLMHNSSVSIFVKNRKTNKSVRMVLRDKYASLFNSIDLEEAINMAEKTEIGNLFEIISE